jgi:hypothetical protein
MPDKDFQGISSKIRGFVRRKPLSGIESIGKKCEFCGRDAFSGAMGAGDGAIYWCYDCGSEHGRIVMDLLMVEQPELLGQSKAESSFLSFCSDAGLVAWSVSASQRATQALKERRRQDGRDKSSRNSEIS